jgi:hypothetical protein
VKEDPGRAQNGNWLAAWRRNLDKDGAMRVNRLEFAKVCKKLEKRTGETLNVNGAWRAVDADLSGWASLREFDPHSFALLLDFKRAATAQFGSCQKFLQQISVQPVTLEAFRKELSNSSILDKLPSPALAKSVDADPTSISISIPAESTGSERTSQAADNNCKQIQRKATLQAMDNFYNPQIDELFAGLDVDGSGHLNAYDVLCVDKWDVDEDEAEEKNWSKFAASWISDQIR